MIFNRKKPVRQVEYTTRVFELRQICRVVGVTGIIQEKIMLRGTIVADSLEAANEVAKRTGCYAVGVQ